MGRSIDGSSNTTLLLPADNMSAAIVPRVAYKRTDSALSKTFEYKVFEYSREAVMRIVPIVLLGVLNIQIMFAFRQRQNMRRTRRHKPAQQHTALVCVRGACARAHCTVGDGVQCGAAT
jgi:hypothetical protein